jgi:hypothetical protein
MPVLETDVPAHSTRYDRKINALTGGDRGPGLDRANRLAAARERIVAFVRAGKPSWSGLGSQS